MQNFRIYRCFEFAISQKEMLKFRKFTMLKYTSFALQNFRRYFELQNFRKYFELQNVRILHCKIFVFHIAKFSYFTFWNFCIIYCKIAIFLHFAFAKFWSFEKWKNFSKENYFSQCEKQNIRISLLWKLCISKGCFVCKANFAMRTFGISQKFLQKTYLKAILNKFHLYWIASCGDIQRALMAEQWTVKMNYNGAPILKISKFYIS